MSNPFGKLCDYFEKRRIENRLGFACLYLYEGAFSGCEGMMKMEEEISSLLDKANKFNACARCKPIDMERWDRAHMYGEFGAETRS